jgi:hypothetical protein
MGDGAMRRFRRTAERKENYYYESVCNTWDFRWILKVCHTDVFVCLFTLRLFGCGQSDSVTAERRMIRWRWIKVKGNLSLRLTKHDAVKTYGGVWRWLVRLTPRQLYPRRRSPRYTLDKRLRGPQNRSGRLGDEKMFYPVLPSPYPVANAFCISFI